jgi:hypothetical protein
MEECKTKFVPKFIKQSNEKTMRKSMKIIDDYKTQLKKETDEEKKKELKKKKEFWEKILQVQKADLKKTKDKQKINMNVRLFCNPGCVGTVFQEAEFSDADLEKMYEWAGDNKDTLIKEMKKSRKNLRKGRKTILKDNFYHKFDSKTKKRLIKEGALSGCIVGL